MFPSLGPKIEKLIGKEQELLDAARTGNAEGIEKLIAIKLTRKSTVGAKLQSFFKSVNINCRDKNGYTPLHHAVLNGHQNVVTLLLHYEAQPNVVDNQGCNPVHLAAWNGNQEILRLLLSAGTMPDDTAVEPVHVNQQSGSGDTALHCAAQYGHVEVVDVLLQRQANPNIRNLTEASPLDLAAQYGHIKVVNLLLMSHPELVLRPSCTQSPLHLAASNGHRDIVALLLDNKFFIQTMTEAGTCLHQAALHGKLDVVKLLLERGIDVHSKDHQGNTALMLVENHQTQQKSYSDITRAIKEHIARTEGVPLSEETEDLSVYGTLATCSSGHSNQQTGTSETKNAVVPTSSPTLAGPRSGSVSEERTPDRPVPKKRPSFKTPPDVRKTSSPQYATVNKEKSGALESVSMSSSHPPIHSPPPPPLPPRFSVIPKEDALSNSDLSGVGQADTLPDQVKPIPKVRSLSIPKKPPRQKKSPALKRRSPPNVSDQCPDSPMSSPKSTSSIPDSEDVQKTFDIPEKVNISKDTDQRDVAAKPLLHSNPNFDLSGATTESKSDQSKVVTLPSSNTVTSPVSPKPELPPKTRLSSAKILDAPKVDNSVDPVTGKQVNQSFYLEMKSPETSPSIQMVSTNRNDAGDSLPSAGKSGAKIDHYGILYPKFKTSPTRLKKTPPLTRSQTAPEENIYVGHAPSATLLREKEKVLQRSNTVPTDDQSNLPLAPLPVTNREASVEPEYSEIPEKSPPVSPSSPIENVYSTIAEVQGRESVNTVNCNVEELSTLKKEVTEEQSIVTKGRESLGDSEPTESCEAANSVKPNYLDFLKRNSATPLTPTGYPQPPTPDFPPPSPATAMMGIELKIQEMDSKRKSRDMTTLTDEILEGIQTHNRPVRTEEPSSVLYTTSSKVVETIAEVSEEETKSNHSDVNEGVEKHSESAGSKLNDSKANSGSSKNSQSTLVASVGDKLKVEKSVIKLNSENKGVPKSSTIPSSSVIQTGAGSQTVDSTGDKMSRKTENKSKTGKSDGQTKEGADSPVMMRKKSSPGPDMDLYKGLLRGSIIGGPRKVLSQFYDDPIRKQPAVPPIPESTSIAALRKNIMEKGDEIDVDQFMQTLDAEVARRSTITDPSQFDDSEEWEKIQDTLESFGASIARESVFIRDFEPAFTKLLAGTNQVISVGDWLQSIGLGLYENAFIANGFDNVDFLDPKILEEQDLEQIGVLSHDHRQKILQTTKSLPQLKPIDPQCPPKSVEEWLISLHLLDYLDTFCTHGYDTMEKVESILWELQLRTVLDISMLGHRKRILASLGERQMPEKHPKKSISSLSPEEGRSRFGDLDFVRDYTKIKPVSSSEEDIKSSTQMQVDSSEDEDVFLKKKGGQQISNSNIHVRPPHMANTNSPAKVWRHKPEMLIKGCCNYTAQYLGSTVVPELTGGTKSTRAGITKLKKSSDVLAKIPIIMLSISYKGVKFIDAKTKKVICDHEIGNIFCACQDTENLNFFAYITRDIESGQHYCHVFSVKSASLAHDIILTLGESFEVAYQMALKEKSNKEAMELDRKMSQSDAEDTYSISSKMSTNTV